MITVEKKNAIKENIQQKNKINELIDKIEELENRIKELEGKKGKFKRKKVRKIKKDIRPSWKKEEMTKKEWLDRKRK